AIDLNDTRRLAPFINRVLEFVERHETGARLEYLIYEAHDLVEPTDEERCETGERNDVTDAQFAAMDEIGTDDQDNHHGDRRSHALQGAGERPPVEDGELRAN